ncbi:hybrid sensor histidine kinase/response regulator [Paraliomyxa miuraensis]|uniref:hybrid sensor histidine kinase/response regulator n=1 Tax=Paraliomyxa miuraensis TaxID=376150 RepID=UPI00225778DA|nr:response regulator [Paraliomyxa miuraensis]MCX4246835.1 response regulator [Paraliomyxa miuraensis]
MPPRDRNAERSDASSVIGLTPLTRPYDGDANVLVVDDDPEHLAVLEAALTELGVRVTTSSSGEDALQHAMQRSFAVILLDVDLPGIDGFETARLIRSREHGEHVPIMFITGHRQHHHDVQRGYELGAVDYLFEPIVPSVLRAKVKTFVDLHDRTMEVDRLSEADRRKDEFIALLAHELRTPLMPLVAGLRLIATRSAADPVVSDARDKMERHVRHLERLVDDLTDIARIREGKLEMDRASVDLGTVVDQARDMCCGMIAKRHQLLIIEGQPGAVAVHADPVRLTQVVSNLLTNASRYSYPGGRIWVHWGCDGEHAFVRVADEGRGIRPEFIERVFDPFSQERSGSPGLGLGLALVRQIVETHRGNVQVESQGPGRGSEIVVTLPAAGAPDPGEGTTSIDPEATAVEASSLRVVLVEDCVDIRELLGHLIAAWGHTVVDAVGSGREGVERLIGLRPDVAIVDIDLPDLDGYEVARRIHAELGDERPGLVAVSGFGQEHAQHQAFEAGFDVMLVKPPDPELLRETIESVGERRRATSVLPRCVVH